VIFAFLGGFAGIIIGGLAGLIIGSFVAALTLRWPAGRSVVGGRSHCDACGKALGVRDLVPVLSFLALRGRCRHCHAAIAPRHLWVELAAGGIGAVSLAVHPGASGIAGAGLGWGLLALAILDVEHFWLPDRITLPLGLAGLVAGAWLSPPLLDRAIGAVAGFACLSIIALVYKSITGRTGLGGGDPKLLAAIGAWLGWTALPFVLLLAAVLGLVLAGLDRLRGRPVTGQTRVPLGALLAVVAWPLWLVGPPLAFFQL
jgi:leader peptidase (prepilin peptidase)/N-methyltransferase